MQTEEDKKLLEWMMGNTEAVQMLKVLGEITQLADDIADGDIKPDPMAMATLLHLCMVILPSSNFYLKNLKWFTPIFNTSITIWAQTDKWAKEAQETAKLFSFVYREHFEQVIIQAALLVAGWEHSCYVADEMNKFYHRDSEKFEVWKTEKSNG